jgi:hypothetical protein
MKVVVAGWVAPFPTAGFLWHALSYALGFRDAGHEVWFLDDSGDAPWGYDPETGEMDPECRAGARFLARELDAVGLGDRWVFRHVPTGRFDGMDEDTTLTVLAEADVFVNVSLTCAMRPEYRRIPQRLGIDTDPVFTQVRVARGDGVLAPAVEEHTRLFTFGRPPLPAQQGEWVPTRQAVATAHWPVAGPPDPGAPFTTLTTWKAYEPESWDGKTYAAKDVSLRAFLDLPSQTQARLSVALGAGEAHQEGARLLREHGWALDDPIAASRTTGDYHGWLARSAGEIGFAKHGYVAARSGWFSERSCCYLASGRPVVAQDTGWSQWLPSGEGLLAFSTVGEAAAALDAVRADPARHAAAARALVEEHFEAAAVCEELLEAAL